MSRSTGGRDTLYDQVLEHASREIDDATAKIEELKKTLVLLEARVEASKSVYEAVAARLNLEDEGNLPEASYPDLPPRLEELETGAGTSVEAPASPAQTAASESETPSTEPPTQPAAVETQPETLPPAAPKPPPAPKMEAHNIQPEPEPLAEVVPPEPVPENGSSGDGNGAGNDVSMDLIRQHLEDRAKRNQSELQVTPRPAIPTVSSDPEAPEDEGDSSEDADVDDSRTVGFPGLSDSDRRLIEEHMRRRAGANQDR